MAEKYVDIMFGPYEPDWGGAPRSEMPGYLVDAVNIRSTPNGYRGMATFADIGSATTASASTNEGVGACFYGGATILTYTDPYVGNITYIVPSTPSFFWINDSGTITESRDEGTDTWQDVTPVAGSTLSTLGNFLFFGGDVIYVDYTRAPIKKTLSAAHATDFSDLAGSPPTARCGAVVGQHVVLGGLISPDAQFSVQTSAIGDHEDWPTAGTADARSKQSIREDLDQELGPVRAVLGGENIGIVVQDQALTRMTYIGGSAVYKFDVFERLEGGGIGRASRFATDGKLWYWHNDYGVYATDGYAVRSISEGKLDEALFNNNLSHPNGASLGAALSTAYDARRAQIIFANRQGSGGAYHLTYNVVDGNFSFLNDTDVIAIFGGFSLDENGARHVYNVNSSTFKLQKLNSSTPTIAFQTGYIELERGQRVQIHGAYLLGANVPSTLTLAYKMAQNYDDCDVSQSGFTSFTAASGRSLKSTGRDDAPFFAFRVTGTGAESQLYRGIRVFYEVTGPIQ